MKDKPVVCLSSETGVGSRAVALAKYDFREVNSRKSWRFNLYAAAASGARTPFAKRLFTKKDKEIIVCRGSTGDLVCG